MFLGEKIREVREARKMTQERLARLSDTSLSTIRRIELMKVNPYPATLDRISVALGVAPDFFDIYLGVFASLRAKKRHEVVA